MNRDEDAFFNCADEARKLAFTFTNPLIVHHYDADGLSSGAIVCNAFIDEGKRFRRLCVKKLDDQVIEKILKEKEVIFVDLGGGNKRVNELQDVLIIDHHQTSGIEKMQVNPLLFGIDGGAEISAAGVAYCVFKTRIDLAIVGACGDMQKPFLGLNRKLVDEGIRKGEVIEENDLCYYGRYSRPLTQFLAYADEPFIYGITYREDKVAVILKELGLDLEAPYASLNLEQRKKLVSTIIPAVSNPDELFCDNYVFPQHPKDETYEASEFGTLLNACGRHNHDEIGIGVCLNDQESLVKARGLLQQHRTMLRNGIDFAKTKMQRFSRYYFLDARGIVEESIVGIVCGMSGKKDLPVIGVSIGENNTIKVSGRGTKKLIENGLNLGDLMKKASEQLGGVGGGHKIAAGCSIPKDKLNEFLIFTHEFLKK